MQCLEGNMLSRLKRPRARPSLCKESKTVSPLGAKCPCWSPAPRPEFPLIAEYSGGTPVAEYIHGPGTDEMHTHATAIGRVYYSGDALNSVAALTDGSENVVEKYRYMTFGQPTVYDATGTNVLSESAYRPGRMTNS